METSFNKFFNSNDDIVNILYDQLKHYSSIKNIAFYEFITLNDINENEKRNYHLWKYMLNFIKAFPGIILIKFIYLFFATECLGKNKTDYSAFSFLVNAFEIDISYLNIYKQTRDNSLCLDQSKKPEYMYLYKI